MVKLTEDPALVRQAREIVCTEVSLEEHARRSTVLEPFGGGGWFTGECPLENHDEKDQSFYISPAGTWRCEECGQGGDVVDLEFLCGDHSSPSEAIIALGHAYGIELPEERNGHRRQMFSSAAELMRKEMPPVRWVVPGILPEGVALLAGKPKLGKSWMGLGTCVAVAAGGHALGTLPVTQGAALYLALEDNERRLQSRLRKVLAGREVPPGLDYSTVCPRLDEGGLEAIAGWLGARPGARLVVIDTLAKIRPRTSGKNVYQEDYEALETLLPLAAEHNVAIVVVHHLRKQGATDPLDEVNSSIGLTGGVDGALILKRDRTRADASLFVTGRDVEEERDLALSWSAEVGAWTLVGDADEYRASQERQEILDYVRETGGPVGVKEVATALQKNYKTVAALMQKMLKAGVLSSPAYGKYEAENPEPAVEVPTIPTVPTGHTGEQNSPSAPPIGSVGTVRTSRKSAHSGVGTPVGTGEVAEGTVRTTDVAELLADPPEWLKRQTEKHLEDPREGTLKALCASVAHELLGNPRRGEEVQQAVEEALKNEGG